MNRLATIDDVQQRIEAITTFELPSNLITEQELELRLLQAQPTNVITESELEERLADTHKFPGNGPKQADFTALTQTLTAALNQVAANVESKATKQDVSLAGTAVDAKFDMLRSAIREATDFDTLKARLLAVLE